MQLDVDGRKVEVSFEFISPEKAQEEIDANANGHNRALRKGHVSHIANAISRDEWLFTGDTVKYDWNGNLIDAQHRYSGVAKSGKGQWFLIVRGVDPNAIDVIDAEIAKRSLADVLKMNGYKNYSDLASTVNNAWPMEFQKSPVIGGFQSPTMQQAIDFIDRRPTVENSAKIGKKMSREALSVGVTMLTPAEFGAYYEVCSSQHPALADNFFDQVASARAPKGSNAALVRKRINTHMRSSGNRTKPYVLGLFVKGWNAEVEGKTLKTLSMKHSEGGTMIEPVPAPLGLDYWHKKG